MNDLKSEHDALLAEKPSDVEHDIEQCPFCNSDLEEGGDMSNLTYTEDEVKEAVEAAVTPLKEQLSTYHASEQAEAVEARINEAVSEKDAEISELQKALDSATLRADTSEQAYDSLVAYLEGVSAEEAAEAERAARKDARLAAVKEVASFREEYLNGNIDRWTAMDDESFDALLVDWKAVATAAGHKEEIGEVTEATIPASTAMDSTRNESDSKASGVREVMRASLRGIDLKTIN